MIRYLPRTPARQAQHDAPCPSEGLVPHGGRLAAEIGQLVDVHIPG